MSETANVELIRQLYDTMSKGNLDAALAMMTDDVTLVVPNGGLWPDGRVVSPSLVEGDARQRERAAHGKSPADDGSVEVRQRPDRRPVMDQPPARSVSYLPPMISPCGFPIVISL